MRQTSTSAEHNGHGLYGRRARSPAPPSKPLSSTGSASRGDGMGATMKLPDDGGGTGHASRAARRGRASVARSAHREGRPMRRLLSWCCLALRWSNRIPRGSQAPFDNAPPERKVGAGLLRWSPNEIHNAQLLTTRYYCRSPCCGHPARTTDRRDARISLRQRRNEGEEPGAC